MPDATSSPSAADIVAGLRAASDSSGLVSNSAIAGVIAALPPLTAPFPVADFNALVEFAAEQWGRWHVQWLYSPVSSPDDAANAEAKAWFDTWKRYADSLSKSVPGIADTSEQILWLSVAKLALERRLEYCRTRPLLRAVAVTQSKLAIIMNKLGAEKVGGWLYCRSLYPPGVVGRVPLMSKQNGYESGPGGQPPTAAPSLAKSARRTAEDLLVGLCGLVTSLVTGVLLWVVEERTGFAFYTFMWWFIIPVGAGLAGFAAASGHYAGARFFGHRPSRIFMANVILCSLSTFFLIHYLAYSTLLVDGKQVSAYIPFTTYLDLAIRSSSIDFSLRGARMGGTGELGSSGYLYALVQVAGFAFGGFAVYGYLTQQPYCKICACYMSKKGERARYMSDAEQVQTVVATVSEHISSGQLSLAIEAQRTGGNVSPSRDTHLRTRIQIRHCKKCHQHWMRFSVAKKSGNDWKDIPDLVVGGFTDQVVDV